MEQVTWFFVDENNKSNKTVAQTMKGIFEAKVAHSRDFSRESAILKER